MVTMARQYNELVTSTLGIFNARVRTYSTIIKIFRPNGKRHYLHLGCLSYCKTGLSVSVPSM